MLLDCRHSQYPIQINRTSNCLLCNDRLTIAHMGGDLHRVMRFIAASELDSWQFLFPIRQIASWHFYEYGELSDGISFQISGSGT